MSETINQNPAAGTGASPPPAENAWLSYIPEDVRSAAVFSSVKAKDEKEALGIISKQLVHAQKAIGQDRVEKPKADWDAARWNQWRQEVLGVPKTDADYKFDLEKYKEHVKPEGVDELRKLVATLGLTQDQASKLAEEVFGKVAKETEDYKRSQAEQVKAWNDKLVDMWGNKIDAYKQYQDYAERKLSEMSPVIKELFESDPTLKLNPGFAEMMRQIGTLLSDDKALGTLRTGAPMSTTSHPVDIQRRIQEITADAAYARVMANGGPESYAMKARFEGKQAEAVADIARYKALVEERTSLYQKQAEMQERMKK